MTETRTISEITASHLLEELKRASRLIAAYERTERDKGNKWQADAIRRHNVRIGDLIRDCSPNGCA